MTVRIVRVGWCRTGIAQIATPLAKCCCIVRGDVFVTKFVIIGKVLRAIWNRLGQFVELEKQDSEVREI